MSIFSKSFSSLRAFAGPTALVLVAAYAAVAPSSGSPTAEAPTTSASVLINGVPVARVMYQGKLMELQEFESTVGLRAEATHSYLNLEIDPSAIERGYLVAFSDRSDAERYERDHFMSGDAGANQAAGDQLRAARMTSAPRAIGLNGRPISLAACDGQTSYYAELFDGLNCTNQRLSMLSRDIVNDMRVYSFNDKTSSFWLGQCIVSLKLFLDISLTGEQHTFGGGGQAYTFVPYNFNNKASSATTPGANC